MGRKLLWLDDYRDPFINLENRVPPGFDEIIWVKNYSEFVNVLTDDYRSISAISFDHDLADSHYTPEHLWSDYDASKEWQDAQIHIEKTGYECAKWLVDFVIDNDLTIPEIFIHSANPVGADNIKFYLNNYLKNYESGRNYRII